MNVPDMDKAAAVEWWVHKRPITSTWMSNAHQLHFDTDEKTFQQGSRVALQHPLWSCIVYLSNDGGPTLITNKEAGVPGLGDAGVLVPPRIGRCALYRGNLLHGVIPQMSPGITQDSDSLHGNHSTDKTTSSDVNRITLIMAWWGKDAGAGRDNMGGVGPIQRLPQGPLLDKVV